MARKPMKKFAAGGDAAQTARYARKTADIESDYQKALKAGRSSGIAKAKYEQRMADAADDLAKWTRSDRTQTRAAESAAEKALSEARRTKGVSALRSQTPAVFKSMMDEGPIGVTPGAEVGRVASPSTTRATPRPRAAAPPPRREAPAPKIPVRAAALADAMAYMIPGYGDAPTLDKRNTPKSDVSTARGYRGVWGTSLSGNPVAARDRARRAEQERGDQEAAATAKAAAEREAKRRRDTASAVAAGRWPADTPDKSFEFPYKNAKGGAIKKKPAAKKPAAKKPVMKYAKGGSIDGCAIRGKTRVGRK